MIDFIENIKNNMEKEEFLDEIILIRILKFFELLCEGHNSTLQNFLREQTYLGKKIPLSLNFIVLSATFFGNYIKFANVLCFDLGLIHNF